MMRLSLFAVLLLAAPLATAQTTFGLRAGLNVATISADPDLADAGPQLGFVGGVFADVPLATGFSIQPEVLYTAKGVDRDAPNVGIGVDYLEVPFLLKVDVPIQEFLDVEVYAGPALAVKLSGEAEDVRFNTTNIGAAVGLGVASGPFGVDARYTFSLADATEGELNDFRHQVVGLTGVYRFGR